MSNIDLDLDKYLTKYLKEIGIDKCVENASTMPQEEFKEIRFDGFGASDSSRIMNVNPFPGGSATELLHEKIHRIHDETIGHKPSVRMGRELEDFIIDKTESILRQNIFKPSHMYGTSWNGLNTNFDGVLLLKQDNIAFPYELIPAEIKTISFYGQKYYDFGKSTPLETDIGEVVPDAYDLITDKKAELQFAPDDFMPERKPMERHILFNAKQMGIPPYYYTQLQQQIDFLDSDYGYLFALNSKDWRIYCFKAAKDKYTINSLKARAKKLYDRLKEARENES